MLDNIYSNVTQITNTIHSGVFKTDYSDHLLNILCYRFGNKNTEYKIINKRDFCQKMSQTLKELLINITGNHYRLIAVKLHFLIFKTYSLNVS